MKYVGKLCFALSAIMVLLCVILCAYAETAATIEVSKPLQITSNQRYERNPSAFVDSLGKYWVFYARGDTCNTRDGCSVDGIEKYMVYYITSMDDGVTWSAPVLIDKPRPNDAKNFSQKDISAFDDASGNIWVFASSGDQGACRHMVFYRSEDNGSTWTNGTPIAFPGTTNDTNCISDLSGTRLGHSHVIYANNKIYLAYQSSGGSTIKVTASTDGSTWTTPVQVYATGHYVPKLEYSGGNLYMVTVLGASGQVWLANSSDDGATWSTKQIGGSNSGWGDWDPSIAKLGSGNLLVVWAPNIGSDGQKLRQMYSTDNGATWSSGKDITKGYAGAEEWWDYWPQILVDGGITKLFYTSEMASNMTAQNGADIWMFDMDWSLDNEHRALIDDGIADAADGNIVRLAAGTYNVPSQIEIAKNMSLVGADRSGTIINGSRSTLTLGGDGLIYVHDIRGVVMIENVTLQNAPFNDAAYNTALVHLKNMKTGANVTVRDVDLIGRNDSVDGWDDGVFVKESSAGATVNVVGCDFSGMQIGLTAERSLGKMLVQDNSFHDLMYGEFMGEVSSAIGIMYLTYFDESAGDVSAQQHIIGNVFQGYAGMGIAIQGGHGYIGDGKFTDVLVEDNSFDVMGSGLEHMHVGIYVLEDHASSAGESGVHNALILNNVFSAGGADSRGVVISGRNTNITLRGNNMTGLDRAVSVENVTAYGPLGVNVTLCRFSANEFGVHNSPVNQEVIAEGNHWGSADGPGGNGPGTGDNVSSNVDFSPYYSDLGLLTLVYDEDGDGFSDDTDMLDVDLDEPEATIASEGFSDMVIDIDGAENEAINNSELVGEKPVKVKDGVNPVIEFNHNFGEKKLDLRPVNITKGAKSIVIRGINLTSGQTKAVYVDITDGPVCVKDAEVLSISEISLNCDGANETLFSVCSGTKNGITCEDVGSRYKISGLAHSAVANTSVTKLYIWDSLEGTSGPALSMVQFFANYTNVTSGEAISGADCNIWFDYEDVWHDMEWNGAVYNYSASFPASDTYYWNVSCSKAGYDTLNVQDDVVIEGGDIPEFGVITSLVALACVSLCAFACRKRAMTGK